MFQRVTAACGLVGILGALWVVAGLIVGVKWVRALFGVCVLLSIAGCTELVERAIDAKAISNTRISGVGVAALPGGETILMPKGLVGVFEVSHTTVPTAEGEIRSPAVLNRTGVKALGANASSTSAHGDVGDEFELGGEHIGRAIEALHNGDRQGLVLP